MSGSQLRNRVEAGDKAWITQLNLNERSSLVATFAGWMLDGMDVMVYSLVLPTLISLWHISKGEADLLRTFAPPFLSFGGWLRGTAAEPRRLRECSLRPMLLLCAFYLFF